MTKTLIVCGFFFKHKKKTKQAELNIIPHLHFFSLFFKKRKKTNKAFFSPDPHIGLKLTRLTVDEQPLMCASALAATHSAGGRSSWSFPIKSVWERLPMTVPKEKCTTCPTEPSALRVLALISGNWPLRTDEAVIYWWNESERSTKTFFFLSFFFHGLHRRRLGAETDAGALLAHYVQVFVQPGFTLYLIEEGRRETSKCARFWDWFSQFRQFIDRTHIKTIKDTKEVQIYWARGV